MNDRVIDDLIAIRALLVLRGRAVDDWVDDSHRVCLGQAMMMVCGDDQHGNRFELVADVLMERMPLQFQGMAERDGPKLDTVVAFNDQCHDEHVLELIDKTLADLGGLA